MDDKKYFGTDGIRGKVGADLMNPAWLEYFGQVFGTFSSLQGINKIGIAYDSRDSGVEFSEAIMRGIIKAGVDVYNFHVLTTPAFTYALRYLNIATGVMVSASHNPYYDNGLKCFALDGRKFSINLEQELETMLGSNKIINNDIIGKVIEYDITEQYVYFCKKSFHDGFALAGSKIVIDCANGAGYLLCPQILECFGGTVVPINCMPNGRNINENCGATSLNALCASVLAVRADFGIAVDGDGDRVIMVDSLGNVFDGDDILYILALRDQLINKKVSGVVGTIMSNLGLEVALKKLDIDFYRSVVGDRNVLSALQERKWFIGGETSGHIIYLPHQNLGDGILVALQTLLSLQELNMSFSEIRKRLVKSIQVVRNVRIVNAKKLQSSEHIQTIIQKTKRKLGADGRVVIRASGTEPIIRIMLEGNNVLLLEQLANNITEEINKLLMV